MMNPTKQYMLTILVGCLLISNTAFSDSNISYLQTAANKNYYYVDNYTPPLCFSYQDTVVVYNAYFQQDIESIIPYIRSEKCWIVPEGNQLPVTIVEIRVSDGVTFAKLMAADGKTMWAAKNTVKSM